MEDEQYPTVKDLLTLAADLNDVLEGIEPTEFPLGHFSLCPSGYGAGSISFESWGPGWSSDNDDRVQVDPDDEGDDPPRIPLRDYMINEMEKLGQGIMEFVARARRGHRACETCTHYEGGMDTWGHCALRDEARQDGDWCEGWDDGIREASDEAEVPSE